MWQSTNSRALSRSRGICEGYSNWIPYELAWSGVAVTVGVRSDADDATLNDLGHPTTHTSTVYDSLAHPVPMSMAVQRLP